MEVLLAIPVVLFLALLAYGGLTGRIRNSSGCCAPPDPADDLRMRDALDDPPAR